MGLTNEIPVNEADAVAGGTAAAAAGKARLGSKRKLETKSAAEAAGGSRKAAESKSKPTAKPAAKAAETKTAIVVKKLSSPKGVTTEVLMEATGWQAHSVRGFLSAVVKKKLGLNLVNEMGKDGVRRYRIENAIKSK